MNPESRGSKCLWVSELVHVGNLSRKFRSSIDSSILCKWHIRITIILLVVVFLVVGAYHGFRPVATHGTAYYTVVVDCGSTGSRVSIYNWFINSTVNEEYPTLLQAFPDHSNQSSQHGYNCQYHCMQTEPGLDKFVGNTSGVRGALEPLLLWAEKEIPFERHGDTSLFVLATAGLRKLPTEDAYWVLGTVEEIVKTHSFVCRRSWIRVLSGQEEAYYGWVALNYKMERLNSPFKVPTFGVLDLGGSSLQVVMETDQSREDHHIVKSNIGSVEHDILAYSLSAFGLNEAFDRTVLMLSESKPLIKDKDGTFQIRHPCLSSGVSRNYTYHGFVHPNATYSRNTSGQLLENFPRPLNLVGDPNWEQCKGLARDAAVGSNSTEWFQLMMDMNCNAHLSTSEGYVLHNLTVSPRRVTRFHALSGFFAVYNVLNLSPKANLTNILERGRDLCSHQWSDLDELPGPGKYAEQFCFNVPYLASLLKDALCMGDTEVIFGPGDVSWTLGAALVEGRPVWLDKLKSQDGTFTLRSMEVISIPNFLLILLLCLSFVVCVAHVMRTAIMPNSVQINKTSAVGVLLPSFVSLKRQSN